MTRFHSYEQAKIHAQSLADMTKLDVAIRRQVEFCEDGYNVSFAAKNDSDYALAEIIKPRLKLGYP